MKKFLLTLLCLSLIGCSLFADLPDNMLLAQVQPDNEVLPDLESGNGFSFTNVLRGLLGLAVLLGIAYLFSVDRKKVAWKVVGTGLLIQLVLALGVLQVPFVWKFLNLLVISL